MIGEHADHAVIIGSETHNVVLVDMRSSSQQAGKSNSSNNCFNALDCIVGLAKSPSQTQPPPTWIDSSIVRGEGLVTCHVLMLSAGICADSHIMMSCNIYN